MFWCRFYVHTSHWQDFLVKNGKNLNFSFGARFFHPKIKIFQNKNNPMKLLTKMQETVSQIFEKRVFKNFMANWSLKNINFCVKLTFHSSRFYSRKTRTHIKILRHGFLRSKIIYFLVFIWSWSDNYSPSFGAPKLRKKVI